MSLSIEDLEEINKQVEKALSNGYYTFNVDSPLELMKKIDDLIIEDKVVMGKRYNVKIEEIL